MDPDVRVIAFAERPPADEGRPGLLHVYVVNESPATLRIQDDLDSINVPQAPPHAGGTTSDADLTHIDFGVSESATFREVAQGECVKVTLLLRPEQLALLQRVKQMKTAVKFRDQADEDGDVRTLLLAAPVYPVTS